MTVKFSCAGLDLFAEMCYNTNKYVTAAERKGSYMYNDNQTQRQQRLKIQQGVISVVCLALIIFVLAWLISTAVTGRKHGLLPVSSGKTSVETDEKESKKNKEKKTDKNDGADTDSKDNADSASDSSDEAASLPDTVIPELDISGADSVSPAAYENAAMKDDFSDACFIGDSRTVGLELNCDKSKADFYASQGLNISSALTDQIVTLENGNMGTVIDGAAQKPYSRIFIMFGINELGWPNPQTFVDNYVDIVNQVKAVQPGAQIYIQSVLPVSYAAANENEVFTNANIDAFNEQYVKQVASLTGTNYLDLNSYFKDASGALPDDAAADGIHFVREYCIKWIDLLAYLVPGGGNV